MAAVLGAFLSTWSNARQTFGQGAPQPGTEFDQSPQLAALRSEVDSANPGAVWSGGGALAYGAVNTRQADVIGRMADLDQRLAAQVDRSAGIVAAGRQDLDAVRQWVLAAASSVPAGPVGEQLMLPIVSKGVGEISGIIEKSNGELNVVGQEIGRLAGEYQMLGELTFKKAPPGITAAHEGREDNYASSEAMDLYNNEIGRNIALANPDATPEELADLVAQSVNKGDTVVIRPDGQGLDWSSGTPSAQTGDSSGSDPGPPGDGASLPSPYPSVGGS